jgi:hypothetical protein
MLLFCIPGKPLGPGTPEGPGGPIGPGGPGVKVDSRTAVVSAKTFKKTVYDKHLQKCGFIICRISKKSLWKFVRLYCLNLYINLKECMEMKVNCSLHGLTDVLASN